MKTEKKEDLTIYIIESANDLNATKEYASQNKETNSYAIRIEEDTKVSYYVYNNEDIMVDKGEIFLDSNGFETKVIEYNSSNEIIRVIEYDNYPNGEAKWIRSYDKEGNLLSEDFYEEDFWED